jgi:hypothetical protein
MTEIELPFLLALAKRALGFAIAYSLFSSIFNCKKPCAVIICRTSRESAHYKRFIRSAIGWPGWRASAFSRWSSSWRIW